MPPHDLLDGIAAQPLIAIADEDGVRLLGHEALPANRATP
jgi:hypothetical protein